MNADQYQHITDAGLLEHFYSDKNNQWLGVLMQRYTLLLLGVCMKYLKNEDDAKDGVQQVFLKVLAELPKYKVEFFKSWVYMVAKNHCLMKLRERQDKIPIALHGQDSIIDEGPETKQASLNKDRLLDTMAGAMDELNKEQKLCVTLFYLDKKSYQEIADITGFSMLQVKSHIQNGKRNLKILIQRRENSNER